VAGADNAMAAPDAARAGPGGQDRSMKTRVVLALWTIALLLAPRAGAADIGAAPDAADPDHVPTPLHEQAQEQRQRSGSAHHSAVRGHELIFNGFRAPSIGLEYRMGVISIHLGAYPTVINEGQSLGDTTAWFGKAGVSLWFLPVQLLGNQRSSFYGGASYLNDFDRAGWGHGVQLEAGFRFVAYEGLFVRLGASALYAPGRSCSTDDCDVLKVRPNPGIGWALALD
jgi:hypothetical protein